MLTAPTLLSRRRSLAAAAAVLATAVAALVAALPSAAAVPVRPIGVVGCDGKAHAQPAEVVLACADAGAGIRKLSWIGWRAPTAVAVGTAYANDCEPSCVAGHVHTYPAVLVASGRQACHGAVAYRTLSIAVIGEPPLNWRTAPDATYTLICH